MKKRAIYTSINGLWRCAICVTLSFVFLCACTDDATKDEPTTPLHINGFLSDENNGTVTRAIQSGYSAFAEPYDASTADDHRIGIFVTRANGASSYGVFEYTANNEWTSQVQVKTGVEHYLYGFMPTSAVSSSQLSTLNSQLFSAGATLMLKGIPAVTAQDICIVTGVAKGAVQATAQNIDDVALTAGSFVYHASYTDNYLYLLFDHLYSRVNIKFTVDAAYDALRTIKVNRLQMATTSGSSTFDASVVLTANTTGAKPMGSPAFTGNGSTTGSSATIYSGELTLSTSEQIIPAYVCPNGQKTFQLTIRYDVYDKSGNLLTQDRSATNTFSLKDADGTALTSMAAGESYELPVTVAPSFLYQLSDADLNNPTIK